MLRITEIIEKSPYYLICRFNNGIVKKLDVLPIIENHKHLNGVKIYWMKRQSVMPELVNLVKLCGMEL